MGWSNKKYFYSSGKARVGPVRWDEFAELFRQAVITADTFVWYKSLPGAREAGVAMRRRRFAASCRGLAG